MKASVRSTVYESCSCNMTNIQLIGRPASWNPASESYAEDREQYARLFYPGCFTCETEVAVEVVRRELLAP
jgi:hypothetical protein